MFVSQRAGRKQLFWFFEALACVSAKTKCAVCAVANRLAGNVPALGEVAKFGTDYFLLKIKFLAKCKRVFTTKFAILPNACCAFGFIMDIVLNFPKFSNQHI